MLLFSSEKKFKEKLKIIFSRYWLASVFVSISAVLSVIDVYGGLKELNKFTFICFLLALLSLGGSMLLTTMKVSKLHRIAYYLALFIAGGGFYLLFTYGPDQQMIYRYVVSGVFAVLAFLFIPFLFNTDNKDFLAHLKTSLINYLLIIVFSGLVTIGTLILFTMLRYLFEIRLDNLRFLSILYAIWSVFSFWLFVSLFPENFVKAKENKFWNKLVNFVTAYVFVPFSVLYSVLIYVYSIGIMVKGEIPINKVIWFLVVMYTLIFIGYILLFESTKKTYCWIRKFLRVFIVVCSPLLVVYFVAICSRIIDYGLTVNRLMIVTVGLFFLLMTLYFGVNKKVQLRFVPPVIAVVLLLSMFGPWSFFNIEKLDQVGRYEQFLIENQFIIDGHVNKNLRFEDYSGLYVEFYNKSRVVRNSYGSKYVIRYFDEITESKNSSTLNFQRIMDYYMGKVDLSDELNAKEIGPGPGTFWEKATISEESYK
jgi:hypothetical protein